MFYQCSSLIYIDLYHINTESNSVNGMFSATSGNFSYCINQDSYIPKIRNLLNSLNTKDVCLNITFPLDKKEEQFEDKACTKEFPYKNQNNMCVEYCTINELI